MYVEKEKYDTVDRARAYSERGLAKHLLGHDQEGAADVNEGIKLAGKDAKEVILDQLASLEQQIKALHQLRAQKKKGIG